MPRGQASIEYLLLITFVLFALVVALVVGRNLLSGTAGNQIAAGIGNVLGLIELFGGGPGCRLTSEPLYLNTSGGTSTITALYQKLTPPGGIITVHCGTGTSINITGCVDALSGSSQCSTTCTYPANTLNDSKIYTVNGTVGTRQCIGINVVVKSAGAAPAPNTPPTVTLESPLNASSVIEGPVVFGYTPADDAGFSNATLYGDFDGTFTAVVTNSTPLVNGTVNNLTTTLAPGTYLWNVFVCDNLGLCSFAPANFTLTVIAHGWLGGETSELKLYSPVFSGLDANASSSEFTLTHAFFPLQPTGLTNSSEFRLSAGPIHSRGYPR